MDNKIRGYSRPQFGPPQSSKPGQEHISKQIQRVQGGPKSAGLIQQILKSMGSKLADIVGLICMFKKFKVSTGLVEKTSTTSLQSAFSF